MYMVSQIHFEIYVHRERGERRGERGEKERGEQESQINVNPLGYNRSKINYT